MAKKSKDNSNRMYAVGLGIVALIIGFILYQRYQNDQALKQAEIYLEGARIQSENDAKLDECLESAEARSRESWASVCETRGQDENCLRPLDEVESHKDGLNDERDLCFRRYDK